MKLIIAVCLIASLFNASAQYSPMQPDEDSLHWSLLTNGVADRPYISDFSVTTNGVKYTVWSGLTSASASPPSSISSTTGQLTALISAYNMCQRNQTTQCYTTPNRIGVSLGVSNNYNMAFDFNSVASTAHTITTDSVFDITIQQNTFGGKSSWCWVNGDLQYYSVNNGVINIKFKPVATPLIDWQQYPNTGCTATPIRDCNVTSSTSTMLSATLVWSVDQTLNAFTGAVFATSGAIMGFLVPVFERGEYNPTLQYQLSGAHRTPTGSLTRGSLKAVLPIAKVQSLYPGYDSSLDPAAYFNVSRQGDSGTQDSITFSSWNASTHGTTGIVFEVTGVTFSAPQYYLTANSAFSTITLSTTLLATLMCVAIAFQSYFVN